MPTATIAGMSRHPVVKVKKRMTPTAIHITATSARKPGLEGRRPTATGSSGSRKRRRFAASGCRLRPLGPEGREAPPLGVVRPLEPRLRPRVAMAAKVSGPTRRRDR